MARLIRTTSWSHEASGLAEVAVAPPPVFQFADIDPPSDASNGNGHCDDSSPPPPTDPLALRRAEARGRADERRRISRLLHDEIGQSLTALTVKIAVLRARTAGSVRSQLRQIHRLLEGTLGQVQTLSKDLHPSVIDDLGLAAALRSRVQRFCRDTSIAVQFQASDSALARVDNDLALAVYRSVEALLEALRQSAVVKSAVSFAVQHDAIALETRVRGLADLRRHFQHFYDEVLLAGGMARCRFTRGQTLIKARFPMTNHGQVKHSGEFRR